MKSILRIAAGRRRVSEERDEREKLNNRPRPTMGENEGTSPFMFGADVEKENIETVDMNDVASKSV